MGLKNALASAQNRSRSEKSIQVPSILRTKTIFNRKIYPSTLILPHQTHLGRPLGFKNALASAEAHGTSESDSRPLGLKNALASAQNRSRSEKSIQVPSIFRTKTIFNRKIYPSTLILPHQTHLGRPLGFKNALASAEAQGTSESDSRPLGLKNALASAQNRSRSEKSIQVPLILRTKTIFNRKIYPSTLILPHQTHLGRPLGFKNALASAEAQGTSESDSRPLGLKNALASAQNRSRSEKSIQVPSILRTKTIFNRKIDPSTLILPHQTHLRRPLGFKNALASAEAQGTSESDSRPLGLKNALASAQNRSRTSPGQLKKCPWAPESKN